MPGSRDSSHSLFFSHMSSVFALFSSLLASLFSVFSSLFLLRLLGANPFVGHVALPVGVPAASFGDIWRLLLDLFMISSLFLLSSSLCSCFCHHPSSCLGAFSFLRHPAILGPQRCVLRPSHLDRACLSFLASLFSLISSLFSLPLGTSFGTSSASLGDLWRSHFGSLLSSFFSLLSSLLSLLSSLFALLSSLFSWS